jgi:hypothetical protein
LLKLPTTLTRDNVLGFLASSASYGNLGLFIGAGFSKAVLSDSSGCIALSWGALLEKAALKMGVDYHSIKKMGVSYPEIASEICTVHSRSASKPFSDSLRQLKYEIANLTSWYPSQEQRDQFASYVEAFCPAWIITTNYDLVIESLLTGRSIPLGPNDALSSPKGIVPVFHLHGVRTKPEDIIISQEDYVALFRPSQYRQIKLALTIKESTTVLIGYGLGDVNVLTALDWSRNVFKGEQENYPNDVVQVLRKSNPNESPYRDKNGIVIIETDELFKFFEEYDEARKYLVEKEKIAEAALNTLDDSFKESNDAMIQLFIDHEEYRKRLLKILSGSSIKLLSGFILFFNRCIDLTWKRSVPSGAFEAYNQNLIIILDILTAFSFDRFPPAVFHMAAHSLECVGPYIGDTFGKSWAAQKTWDSRKSELSNEIVGELRNISAQYDYRYLQDLVQSIPHKKS